MDEVARSERFELPTLGFEVRCSIQLSYERISLVNDLEIRANDLALFGSGLLPGVLKRHTRLFAFSFNLFKP